jgi:predicted GIY-YIG superfamily endonuclease
MIKEGKRTALYRIYDADGALLYVGVTGNPKRRFAEHASDKSWWALAARRDIEWYESRASAEMAERAAIRAHDPYHNRDHVLNSQANRFQDLGIEMLCHKLGLSRSDLVTLLLDRELAARGMLGDAPCYHTVLGWPDGVMARPTGWLTGDLCGCGMAFTPGTDRAACRDRRTG